MEILFVKYENIMKHVNTLCGKNAEHLMLKQLVHRVTI